MAFRKYVKPETPSQSDLEYEQRHVAHTNAEFTALFPKDADPWSWRLPSGNNIEQATAIELMQTGLVLSGLAYHKRNQSVVDVKRAGDGVYEVKLDGRVIGKVHRNPRLGDIPPEIRAKVKPGSRWFATDTKGRSDYDSSLNPGFATRNDAVEALVNKFA